MPQDDTSNEELVNALSKAREQLYDDQAFDPVEMAQWVYQLWWRWADFHLFITSPVIEPVSPPIIIPPAQIDEHQTLEFVYPIQDSGYKLSTSKGEALLTAGMSMFKLYMTIEKMIQLLIERLKSGGIDQETEVQVAFGGHELAQRKAFEIIINLSYNVVVTNFDPGAWGERYLAAVKILADKGYGYPPEAPRDTYRQIHPPASATKKS